MFILSLQGEDMYSFQTHLTIETFFYMTSGDQSSSEHALENTVLEDFFHWSTFSERV